MKSLSLLLLAITLALAGTPQFFSSFPPASDPEGFTQELYARLVPPAGANIGVGVAFIGTQVISTSCDSPYGFLLSPTADINIHDTPMHSYQLVSFPYAGCNIINHPDGFLYYSALNRGVVKLDPANLHEVPIAGIIGGQGSEYSRLGMAVDPQNHNFIVINDNLRLFKLDTTTNQVSSWPYDLAGQHYIDGIYFNGDGSLLVLADTSYQRARIVDRNGHVVASPSIPTPDGVAFHQCSNTAFVASNNGHLYRINLTDFTVSDFAGGAFRGDIGNVGPDSCFYINYAYGIRYNDGFLEGANGAVSSLVKICSKCGFSQTPGVVVQSIPYCPHNPLPAAAAPFNVFSLTGFTGRSSDVGGRVAAGADVSVSGYAFGTDLPHTCAGLAAAGLSQDTLVAGGGVTSSDGSIWGNVAFTGALSLVSTNLPSDCAPRQDTPSSIDFGAAAAQLAALSSALAGLPATGNLTNQWGTVHLVGTNDPALDVFSVAASDLTPNVYTISLENVASTATVVINVGGNSFGSPSAPFGSLGLVGTSNVGKLLWNFPTATSITIQNVQFPGTIVAPQATVVSSSAAFDGQLFIKAWVGASDTTTGEVHNRPFTGCIPAPNQ